MKFVVNQAEIATEIGKVFGLHGEISVRDVEINIPVDDILTIQITLAPSQERILQALEIMKKYIRE